MQMNKRVAAAGFASIAALIFAIGAASPEQVRGVWSSGRDGIDQVRGVWSSDVLQPAPGTEQVRQSAEGAIPGLPGGVPTPSSGVHVSWNS